MKIPTLMTINCSRLYAPPFGLQTRYTGLDYQISSGFFAHSRTEDAYENALDQLYYSVKCWTPKSDLGEEVAVLVKSTMGMHRSVVMAEKLAEEVVRWKGVKVFCEHLDLNDAIAEMERRGYGPYTN